MFRNVSKDDDLWMGRLKQDFPRVSREVKKPGTFFKSYKILCKAHKKHDVMKLAAAAAVQELPVQPVLRRESVASHPESRAAQLQARVRFRHEQAELKKTGGFQQMAAGATADQAAICGEPVPIAARSIPIDVSERVLQELVASRHEETRYVGAALEAQGRVCKTVASLEANMRASTGPSLLDTSESSKTLPRSKPEYRECVSPLNLSGYSRAAAREDVLDVIMEIQHSEAAATVNEQEAAQIVALQHANFIERNLSRSCSFGSAEQRPEPSLVGEEYEDDSCNSDIMDDQVVFGKLNRVPMPLRDELANGPALRFCRQRLEEAGYPWRLFSGAYIFVHPWQYRETMLSLGDCDLRPYHVVYSASLASPLQEALARVKGAWMLTRGPLQTRLDEASRLGKGLSCQRSLPETTLDDLEEHHEPQSGGTSEDEYVIDLSEIVSRTFIHQRPRSARLEKMCTASDSAACCQENHRMVAPWDC